MYLRHRAAHRRPAMAWILMGKMLLLALLTASAIALCSNAVTGNDDRQWSNEPAAGSEDPGPPGRWRTARGEAKEKLSAEQAREIERLSSLAYLSGSTPAPDDSGVVLFDTARAWSGLNFFTSGHFAGAILMDMDGHVLHEWSYDFLEAWPDETESAENDGAEYWRWAHLYENGDLLAIFEGLGLIKLDKDSHLIWKHYGAEHHDLEVVDDGSIYVLTRKAHMVPRVNERMPILEDFVTVLDAYGRVIREVSVLEAFENSAFASSPAARGMRKRGDIYHTNAVEVLDGRLADRLPAFRRGNVFLSMRQLSTIAVLDMDLQEIVWVSSGMWLEQHDPKVLENGNILVFDNKGDDGKSKVVEFDPVTQETEWSYSGDASSMFFSKMCGAAHRLPNGNTIITESDYGRAFEVTPAGEMVWEFLNAHRAGKHGNLIATLFDVIRLDPDFPLGWLE